MSDLNLVLKFRLAGHSDLQVKGAARIKIDRYGLKVYDPRGGAAEIIAVRQLQCLSIQPVLSTRRPAGARAHG